MGSSLTAAAGAWVSAAGTSSLAAAGTSVSAGVWGGSAAGRFAWQAASDKSKNEVHARILGRENHKIGKFPNASRAVFCRRVA